MGAKSFYSIKMLGHLFSIQNIDPEIKKLTSQYKSILERKKWGTSYRKGLKLEDIDKLGAQCGFFKKFDRAMSVSVFTTKGGVLKSTMALNLARTAALHGLKTCVVGLDIQGDITTAMGHGHYSDDGQGLADVIEKLDQIKGLADYFTGHFEVMELLEGTDLPNLFLIPETPELVALNDSLSNIHRREFWLKEKIILPLKEHFDLIIMDCSPNWNKLTTNALVASDVLISPLECKINNFRNFKVFWQFLHEFKNDMRINFENIFVPTKFAQNKKLGQEIKGWYQENVPGCTFEGIRESVQGEEAIALNLSLNEHAPGRPVAKEMVELLKEIHSRIEMASKKGDTIDMNYSPNHAYAEERYTL